MPLSPLELPATDSDWLAWGESYTAGLIDTFRASVAALKDGSTYGAAEVLALWNDGDTAIGDVAAASELLSEVHPDEAVRKLFEDRAREADKLATERQQDVELYALVTGLDGAGLSSEAARRLARLLRDFRLAGVHLDTAARAEVAALEHRITELSQEFSRNIRDDVRSVRLAPERLEGLPADWVAAHPVDEDGLVTVTTDYPDVVPFRTYAVDADARRELTVASQNRAWPANDGVLAELLELRAKKAALLGFDSWAELDAQTKMTGSATAIEEFIARLHETVGPQAQADCGVLLAALRAEDPEQTSVDFSANMHALELVRRERFDVDTQLARRYLDIAKVRQGLLDVTARLFGLQYREVADAPRWHPEVHVYDVALDGAELGRIYLDLHPRDGKFKHAAAFVLRHGVAGRQLGSAALACNFNRGPLLHSEAVTLFHEFGHLVHQLVASRHEFAALSGIATEWDFVEAPSQLLEEWAWDAAVLQTFATDDDGLPIPTDLVERMRAANAFGRGQWAARQLYYTAASYFLHRDRPADRTARAAELQAEYDVLAPLPDDHGHTSFGHLTGYSSAYYTYLWSKVIAADLFTAFDRGDLFEESVAHRYRDLVLAPGGAKDAAQLVEDFLGRPYSFGAFGDWLAGR
ncbi:M3 family metallopeptidase [Gryllotalpicola protaetiae]|uniref:Peptidase M3 n=1 Tax=Gryllotalpicola protaetiae TaxID=2419771 RepID=A0A387BL80_9MICO|nr:M3 family metallopeptidase [Gryllotalpicola protaetiae]AYG04935.1 peptidase M3 [Gryllotalpicola protaetiae]